MASELGTLVYTLTVNDAGFGAKIADARSQMSGLATSASTQLGSMGKSIASAGQSFLPFSIAAGAALGLSVKAAENFNQSMELVHTQAGASQKEVDKLTQSVLKLAPAVGQSPKALADALFFIESSGIRGAKAMDVLKLSAEGAAVGQTDVASTANALTSIMNTNIKGAENASIAMGNLNAIVGAGKMHFADLNAAIGTGFFAAASTFGVSLQSAGAAIAELTRQGVDANSAATRLRMSMTLMAAPTAEAAKVLGAAGFSMNDIKTNSDAMTQALTKANVTTSEMAADLQKPNGFSVAIQDMKDHLVKAGISGSDAAAVIAKAFGGGRTSGPILQMINDTTGLNSAFNQITTSSNNFGEAWQKQQQQSKQKMEDFKATLQVVEIQLGNAFLPILDRMIGFIGKLANAFDSLGGTMKSIIGTGLMLVAGLAPVLIIFGKMATGVSAIVGLFEKLKGAAAVTGLARMATEAGAAEGATAALTGAVGGGGLLAALGGAASMLGPVALGIAGVAAVGIGAYAVIHHLSQAHQEAAAQAQAQASANLSLAKSFSTTQGAQAEAGTLVKALSDNTKAAVTNTQELSAKQAAAIQAAGTFAAAQKLANDALQKYGANSPQYISALEHEASMNLNLDAANKAVATSISQNKGAHDALSTAMKDMNGTYTVAQLMAKANQIASDNLKNAKNKEAGAHSATARAAEDYAVAVALDGNLSPQAASAAENLKNKRNDEKGATQGVQYWTNQVNQLHKDGPQLAKNLQNALNPLISQYHNLQGAASSAYSAEQNALNVKAPSGSMFQNLNPLHRAAGGPVNWGQTYMVGENGPELFTPGMSGAIIPNNAIGNGGVSFSIGQIVLSTASAVREFFSINNRSIQLELTGGSPLAGTTGV